MILLLLGAISIYTLYSLFFMLFNSLRFSHLSGSWAYVTWPDTTLSGAVFDPKAAGAESGRIGYGVMRFFPNRNGDLRYEVNLFQSPQDLVDALSRSKHAVLSVGTAVADALEYDDAHKRLTITYSVHYSNQPSRQGLLQLAYFDSKNMSGDWFSHIGRTQLSIGKMIVCRSRNLKETLEKHVGVKIG
jgi:hypothetical protein